MFRRYLRLQEQVSHLLTPCPKNRRPLSLKVSDTGYFVYCNGDRSQADFGGAMRFLVKVIPYSGDDSWVEEALMSARRCLEGEMPMPTQTCEQCSYLSDIKTLGIK